MTERTRSEFPAAMPVELPEEAAIKRKVAWTTRDEHGAVYVWLHGQLIYKRWPNGATRTFYHPWQT